MADMEKEMPQKNMLYPAIYSSVKASGREVNPCLLCKKKVEKDEKIVETYTSSYKGRTSYTNRYHRKCFLKVIAVTFPELLNDECFDDEFKSKVMLLKVEDENN